MTGSLFLYYDIFCGGEFTNEIFGCCKVIVGSIPNCLIECLARNPTLMVRWPHIFYTDVELFCMVSHASNCITKESIIPDWRLFVMFLINECFLSMTIRFDTSAPEIPCNSRSLCIYIYIYTYIYIFFRDLMRSQCFITSYTSLNNICIVVIIFIQIYTKFASPTAELWCWVTKSLSQNRINFEIISQSHVNGDQIW